jgi:hypothetical protein
MRRVALLIVASVGVLACVSHAYAEAACFVPPPIGVVRTIVDDGVKQVRECYATAIVRKDNGAFRNAMRPCLPRDGPLPYVDSAQPNVESSVEDAARDCSDRAGSAASGRSEAYVRCVRDRLSRTATPSLPANYRVPPRCTGRFRYALREAAAPTPARRAR